MARNPTPFVRAQYAKWIEIGKPEEPIDYLLLPARVYLHPTRNPAVVIPLGARKRARQPGVLVGESPSSGFGGLMLDNQGRYAGSIRKPIRRYERDKSCT